MAQGALVAVFASSIQAQTTVETNDGVEPDTGAGASNAFQRFLRETDCSIAKGTRIVHYPTVHPAPFAPITVVSKDADYEFDPILVESGFNFVQFVKRHRDAIVFSESYWTSDMVDELRETRRALRRASDQSTAMWSSAAFVPPLLRDGSYNIRRIKNALMEADAVSDLDSTTKSLFEAFTGADVALVTGIIDDLLPSTTLGSVSEVFARFFAYHDLVGDPNEIIGDLHTQLRRIAKEYNQADGPEARARIKSEFSAVQLKKLKVEKVVHDSVFFWREYLLLRSVREFVEKRGNRDGLVVISYGAAHDFSDEFVDYEFQVLPMLCSVSFASLAAIHRVVFLVRMAQHTDDRARLAVIHSEIVERWSGLSEFDVEGYVAFRKHQLDRQLFDGAIDDRMHEALLTRIGEAPREHLESELAARRAPVATRIERAFETYIAAYR